MSADCKACVLATRLSGARLLGDKPGYGLPADALNAPSMIKRKRSAWRRTQKTRDGRAVHERYVLVWVPRPPGGWQFELRDPGVAVGGGGVRVKRRLVDDASDDNDVFEYGDVSSATRYVAALRRETATYADLHDRRGKWLERVQPVVELDDGTFTSSYDDRLANVPAAIAAPNGGFYALSVGPAGGGGQPPTVQWWPIGGNEQAPAAPTRAPIAVQLVVPPQWGGAPQQREIRDVDPEGTVAALRRAVDALRLGGYAGVGIPNNYANEAYDLVYNGAVLANKRSLASYGIGAGARIDYSRQAVGAANDVPFTVTVRGAQAPLLKRYGFNAGDAGIPDATFFVRPSTTGAQLKREINERAPVLFTASQRLRFNGAVIADTRTLVSYGVAAGASVDLEYTPPPAIPFTVRVTLGGRVYPVAGVTQSTTVQELRDRLAAAIGDTVMSAGIALGRQASGTAPMQAFSNRSPLAAVGITGDAALDATYRAPQFTVVVRADPKDTGFRFDEKKSAYEREEGQVIKASTTQLKISVTRDTHLAAVARLVHKMLSGNANDAVAPLDRIVIRQERKQLNLASMLRNLGIEGEVNLIASRGGAAAVGGGGGGSQ